MDEIERFSGIPGPLKGAFKAIHGDLYTLTFWNSLTEKLRNGEVFDVTPYDRSKRFLDRDRSAASYPNRNDTTSPMPTAIPPSVEAPNRNVPIPANPEGLRAEFS